MTYLKLIRENNPLIHNITNVVVTNFTANGLLALGASPFMADGVEEVKDAASMAGGLLLNIGTLNEAVVEACLLAGRAANAAGVPVVFDPVGAGATPYRSKVASTLMKQVKMTALRGNIAEVAHVAGESWAIKGVDAVEGEGDAASLAKRAAIKLGCIVAITGREDAVSDGQQTAVISGGHRLLTKVTGTGCLLSSVVAAFLAVAGPKPQAQFEAVCEALASYGMAAEEAFQRTEGQGPGSFQIEFLNQLALLDPEPAGLQARIRFV